MISSRLQSEWLRGQAAEFWDVLAGPRGQSVGLPSANLYCPGRLLWRSHGNTVPRLDVRAQLRSASPPGSTVSPSSRRQGYTGITVAIDQSHDLSRGLRDSIGVTPINVIPVAPVGPGLRSG